MPDPTPAAYDAIADWYETEFLAVQAGSDPIGVTAALNALLGPAPAGISRGEPGGDFGHGAKRGPGPAPTCLELGCGTGPHAAAVRALGWTPVGVDLSSGMLAHAVGRLAVARANAERLPIGTHSLDAVIAVMVHTDMPGYPGVVAQATRVLRPGGAFVHVGVHPCFCGGFADRTDPAATVIRSATSMPGAGRRTRGRRRACATRSARRTGSCRICCAW